MYAGEVLDELVSWTPDQSQPDRLRAEVTGEVRGPKRKVTSHDSLLQGIRVLCSRRKRSA